MLVHNKHLLCNMDGMNIKVISAQQAKITTSIRIFIFEFPCITSL